MKLSNKNNTNIIGFLYALIKINKQDINKCNILISGDFDKNKLITNIKKTATHNKLNCKVLLSGFNFDLISRLSLSKLKNYTKLGNFDIGVQILKGNCDYEIHLISGNGYKLSKTKELEFKNALTEYKNFSTENINNFFYLESCKKKIKPLILNEINLRQKFQNHISKIKL